MTSAAFTLSVRKEARALVPLWGACMLGILVAGAWAGRSLLPYAQLLYGLGSLALGAQSMGHEYANRTVGLLLSHPIDRRALLLVKVLVLLPLLAVLGVVSLSTVVPSVYSAADGTEIAFRIGSLILLSALCLAPTLTLLCRNGIAGVVFTVGIAGGLQTASQMVGYGRTAHLWFWYAMLMVCALGAILGWRCFTQLEAIEGGGRDLQLPGFATPSSAAAAVGAPSRNPVAKLVAKELRLQQMTFAVAGMGLLTIAMMVLRRSFDPAFGLDTLMGITILGAGALPLLIGSLASAEERRMGTLEWQQLMPMSSGAQFAVKIAVALTLALVLSLGLSALSQWFVGAHRAFDTWTYAALGIVLATSASLYVSSLNSSGIRAVMMAMPSILMATVVVAWINGWISIWLVRLFMEKPEWRPSLAGIMRSGPYELPIVAAAVLGLTALLLRFAHHNHASTERPSAQLGRQGGWIAGVILLELALLVVTRIR